MILTNLLLPWVTDLKSSHLELHRLKAIGVDFEAPNHTYNNNNNLRTGPLSARGNGNLSSPAPFSDLRDESLMRPEFPRSAKTESDKEFELGFENSIDRESDVEPMAVSCRLLSPPYSIGKIFLRLQELQWKD